MLNEDLNARHNGMTKLLIRGRLTVEVRVQQCLQQSFVFGLFDTNGHICWDSHFHCSLKNINLVKYSFLDNDRPKSCGIGWPVPKFKSLAQHNFKLPHGTLVVKKRIPITPITKRFV